MQPSPNRKSVNQSSSQCTQYVSKSLHLGVIRLQQSQQPRVMDFILNDFQTTVRITAVTHLNI